MQPLKTLSIGGATYDLFLKMEAAAEHDALRKEQIVLNVGEKVQIQSVEETCGGGASNTSVGFSRLGCTAAFCGIVGEDQWGEKLLSNLKHEHVDVTHATVVEGETSSFSVILSLESGERTILFASGVSEHLHDTTFARDAIKEMDAVYLNHLCETSCMIEGDIVAMLAQKPGIHLSWNPGGCQIKAGMKQKDKAALLKLTTLLLLNKEEAMEFSGEKTIQAAIAAFIKAGVANVCVTDGARGTYASDGKHSYFCPTLKVLKVIDTTGAGDAFGTGASWALLSGESLPTALMAGTLNASSVLGTIGAQAGLLTTTAMHAQLNRNLLTVEQLNW